MPWRPSCRTPAHRGQRFSAGASARPGIDRRTRAMINLGMLTALGRTEEVKIYLEAAPNIGLSREDVREVLMQAAVYCGIPAALDSFRAAQEVFNEQDANAQSH